MTKAGERSDYPTSSEVGALEAQLEDCEDEVDRLLAELKAYDSSVWDRLRCIEETARAFWDTTDEAPLKGFTTEQADLWDDLCDALAED